MSNCPEVLGEHLYALQRDVARGSNGTVVWTASNARMVARTCCQLGVTPKQLRNAIRRRPLTFVDYAELAEFIEVNKAGLRTYYAQAWLLSRFIPHQHH